MELITFGKIIKPQGVKGEVKIKLFTDNYSAISQISEVFLSNEKQARKIKTVSVRFGFAYILFEDVTDRNMAELLRGKDVSLPKEELPLAKDTFLIDDIINSNVYDENNNIIGVLVDVEQYGAADVWVVRSEGREYSFPYVEHIVKKVLPEQQIIIVNKKSFDEAKICE